MTAGVFKHSYKTKTRESLPVAVYNCGIQQCAPGYAWGPGIRDHFLVHHVISGRGAYTADGVTYEISAGGTFLVYPSEVVTYRADDSDPWEYCWVGFGGAEARVMLAQTPFSRSAPVARFSEPDRVKNAVLAVHEAAGTTSASELRAIGQLYLFLALLVEQGGAPPPSADLSLEYVESAVRFIARNFSSAVDVKDVAASVGISRSHLYRLFMRHIGTPPNEYLTRFRISQACELIERSPLPVSAVAASVGYDDQLYFSRVFKKITGKSPSAYLREQTAKEGAPVIQKGDPL